MLFWGFSVNVDSSLGPTIILCQETLYINDDVSPPRVRQTIWNTDGM